MIFSRRKISNPALTWRQLTRNRHLFRPRRTPRTRCVSSRRPATSSRCSAGWRSTAGLPTRTARPRSPSETVWLARRVGRRTFCGLAGRPLGPPAAWPAGWPADMMLASTAAVQSPAAVRHPAAVCDQSHLPRCGCHRPRSLVLLRRRHRRLDAAQPGCCQRSRRGGRGATPQGRRSQRPGRPRRHRPDGRGGGVCVCARAYMSVYLCMPLSRPS